MNKKSYTLSLTVSLVIIISCGLLFARPVWATIDDYNEFLTIRYKEGIQPGESQTLKICLKESDWAAYVVFIISPGDLEYIIEVTAAFVQWLYDYDWDNFDWDEFKVDFENWQSQYPKCQLDVAGKWGVLWEDGNPCVTWIYPSDFDVLSGEPETFEYGRYDVITVGYRYDGCSVSNSWFYTSFFVVPEFPLGTATPVLVSLAALVFTAFKRSRARL